jgi:hypothetical protein
LNHTPRATAALAALNMIMASASMTSSGTLPPSMVTTSQPPPATTTRNNATIIGPNIPRALRSEIERQSATEEAIGRSDDVQIKRADFDHLLIAAEQS